MGRFAELASLADELAGESGKLKKRAAIAEALRRVVATGGPAEAGRFCLYLAGQPFAEADPRKLNAGGALLSRAIKHVTGATDAALGAAYRRHGDLGAAACDLLQAREPPAENNEQPAAPALTLADVAQAFDALASARTTAARAASVDGLLRRATPLEAKYLLKLMLGDMRIGVKQSLVEEAIAEAAGADVAAVRHAVMLEADLSRAVQRAFAGTLADARMKLFHPLGFMLASPVQSPEEAVERFTAKPEKQPKPTNRTRRRSGSGVLPEDAAEEGFAEDVEAEARATSRTAGLSTPAADAAFGRDDAVDGAPVFDEYPNPVIHALLEDKYDGIRAQVHCADPDQPGRVAIYSRNREDITESFPELQEAFAHLHEAAANPADRSLIFDGEILGWDIEADRALPFSVLGQRIGRKRVSDELRRAVPVVFMAFDLMCAGGELLLAQPLRERRARLEGIAAQLAPKATAPLETPKAQSSLFDATPPTSPRAPSSPAIAVAMKGTGFSPSVPASPGTAASAAEGRIPRLRLSPAQMAESAEGIDLAYRDARTRANEGVMIKATGSAYLPGRRGLAWLKLKRQLATLDVVITGAEFGNGRRAHVLSDYTFAVRGSGSGKDGGELLNVGKAYSGLTDAEIADMTEWLKAHTLEDNGHFRTVEPLRVLEVAFNNIMRSDRHASGFALRFPRIVRIRDDKPVTEIDTLERVEEIYQSQPDKGRE